MRTAGIILDVYDDPKGLVLREKLAGRAMPDKLAQSALLEDEELSQLPDRLFGLVAYNEGETVRKYAMCDANHLATSIIYFLECGHLLPEDARVKVASNLINACPWYDMDPPDGLVKIALGLGQVAGGALLAGFGAQTVSEAADQSKVQRQQMLDQFRRAQTAGAKVAAGDVLELSMSDDAAIQGSAHLPTSDTPGHVARVLAKRDQKAQTSAKLDKQIGQKEDQVPPSGEKQADLNGTELMPYGATRKSVRTDPTKRIPLPAKTAAAKLASEAVPEGWFHVGDLSKAEAPARIKRASYTHFALPEVQAYPIDTEGQVKQAASYFEEHLSDFPLTARRIYAQSTYARAQELGIKVAGPILGYAGTEYGPYIDSELLARSRGFAGTGHEVVYEVLAEKRASIPPSVMADLLKEADQETGADRSYGRPGTGFLDPYQAVYGSAKVAETQPTKEEAFSWVSGNDYVNGFMLSALAASGQEMDNLFGEGFTKSFEQDPVGIFQSMPDPQKVVLSRLASDNSGNTLKT